MDINHLLAVGSVAVFPALLIVIFKESPRRFYILYVLFLFPFMDLAITPVEWGRLRVFDIVSYIYAMILIQEFVVIKLKYVVYSRLFALFILVIILGSISSDYIQNSLLTLPSVFPIFIFGKSLLSELSENEYFEREVIQSLRIVAIASVLFVIAQKLIGLSFTFYPALNRNTASEEGTTRFPSFFHDPQMYGQYLVLVCHLFFINYKNSLVPQTESQPNEQNRNWKSSSLDIANPVLRNYLLFAAIGFALLQTGGRSALIAVFVGMLFLVFAFGYQYKLMLLTIISAGVIGYLFFSSSITVFNRVENMSGDLDFRVAIWEEAKEIVKQYPVLGIGFGNFKLYNIDHSLNYGVNEDNEVVFFGYGQPESGYWMILTETGIMGFLVFCSFILGPVISSIKSFLQGNKNLLILILIAGILSWLVAFISAYSLHDKRVLITVVVFISILIFESGKTKSSYHINAK